MPSRIVLEYPSVGSTENIMMAAALTAGKTYIVNAALEPEVLDLIVVLKKMGANITIHPPAIIEIEGVKELKPIEHAIIYDRLEAGSLLLAAAITGGEIALPQAPSASMEVFLEKLQEMGHEVTLGAGVGVWFKATSNPRGVSFKTMPYPGFPTDLQAPMMALLCLASGRSIIHETVFENRLLHIRELQKMGAQITIEGHTATISGVDELYGAPVIATDIRASCALIIAGLVAQGATTMTGVHHLRRGYEGLVDKLFQLGARISMHDAPTQPPVMPHVTPTTRIQNV
jgi:UDP-N-acetylglucosamine 1-carboxyvinyltransferase